MTEQEKKRRRREWERRMRSREAVRQREPRSGAAAFRTYVSAVLVGGCLLLSLFDSASSQAVCQTIKDSIAYQIPAEQVQVWRHRAEAFLAQREIALPVFGAPKEEANTQQEEVYLPDTEESP